MTAATQGLAGPGTPGTQQQGGFPPSFPAPIGAEYPGFPQQYGMHQFGGQMPQAPQFTQQALQAVQQIVGQILPIAQQVITAQVLGMVAQQVQQQLPHLIAQQVQQQLPHLIAQQVQQQLPHLIAQQSGSNFGWQQPSGSWMQPSPWQQYGSPTQQTGLFGQGNRPYAGLS